MTDETKTRPSPADIERDLAADPFAHECLHCALRALLTRRGALREASGQEPREADVEISGVAQFLGELVASFGPEAAVPLAQVAMIAFSAGLASTGHFDVQPVVDLADPIDRGKMN